MYMFKFSEYEATRLASYGRYMNAVLLASCLAAALIAIDAVSASAAGRTRRRREFAALALLLMAVPLRPPLHFLLRTDVQASIDRRAAYEPLVQKINDVCGGDADLMLVAQGDTGYDSLVIRFCVRPNRVDGGYSFSHEPLYEGDVWTTIKTADSLQEELAERFDYVALYWLDEAFYRYYSTLFEDPAEIDPGNVYAVDRETGQLSLCR